MPFRTIFFFFGSVFSSEIQNAKEAFDGAYDRPRGLLQPTRSRSLTDKRHNTAYRISRRRVSIRRGVRWAPAAAERRGGTAPVYRVDGRLPVTATRRLSVSDGVVALRSWHVDFWVTFQVSRFLSFSLPPRCVHRSYMYNAAHCSPLDPSELTLPPATPTRPV